MIGQFLSLDVLMAIYKSHEVFSPLKGYELQIYTLMLTMRVESGDMFIIV